MFAIAHYIKVEITTNSGASQSVPAGASGLSGSSGAGTLYVTRYNKRTQPGTLAGSATTPSGAVLVPSDVRGARYWTLRATEGLDNFTLHNLLGRVVGHIHDGTLQPGIHALPVETSLLPVGVYLVRVDIEGKVLTRRMTVVG